MLPTDDPEKLQLIAEYHNATWSLRLLGIGTVVAGVVMTGIGIWHTHNGGPYGFVIAIGTLLVACGLWSIMVRGAICAINGFVGILVGLLYILDAFVGGGGPRSWDWGICAFMFAAGILGSFSQYVSYSKIFRSGVTSDEIAMLVAFARNILNGGEENEDPIIGFEVKSFEHGTWWGQLMPRMAVFVNVFTRRLFVARKEDVTIEPHSKVLLGSSLKAAITIGDHRWQGRISPTSFERYRDWKWAEAEGEIRRKFSLAAGESAEGVPLKPNFDSELPDGIHHLRRPAPDDAV